MKAHQLCRIRTRDGKVLKVIIGNLTTPAQIHDAEKQARMANSARLIKTQNPDFYYCVIVGGKS